MTSDTRFTVISYNVCGLKNRTRVNELTMFLTTHKPSILIIQEPKIDHRTTVTTTDKDGVTTTKQHTPVTLPKFIGYVSLHFTHPTQPTGVIFYIHKTCTYHPLHHIEHCTPYNHHARVRTVAAFIWVAHPKLSQPVVVGGVYLDGKCTEQDVKALATNIARASQPLPGSPVSSIPLPLFILGDFNARHKSWDPQIQDTTNQNNAGKWVNKRIVTHRTARSLCAKIPPLTLINNMFTNTRMQPTRDETGSVIDLALTSHVNMIESMHILTDSLIGSDHFPISITIKHNDITSHVPNRMYTYEQKHEQEERDEDEMEHKYDEPDEKHGNIRSTTTTQTRTKTTQTTHTNTKATPPPYYIQASTVPGAGYGFFANKRYKKGERIIVYTGEVISEARKKALYPKDDARYLVYVMHDMYIDADDPSKSSDARYINSSGGGYNNAAMHPQHTNNTHTINIVATHDISPGEEVFMPYGSSYHMTRAPRPNRNKITTPDTEWQTHMHAPPTKQNDGRVKWRINEKIEWKMFRDEMEPKLNEWIKTHRRWMPPRTQTQTQHNNQQHQQQQPEFSLDGTLHVVMYTDGASRGNPGAASCGGVIYLAKDKPTADMDATAEPIHRFSTMMGRATNNEAEYKGLLQALIAARELGATHVHAHVDSQLMCRQIQGRYQVRDSKLTSMHEQCKIHISQLQQFNITHIPRKLNAEADKLCNDALDAASTWADEIPDMMDGEETGLNDEQKEQLRREQEEKQEKEEEAKKQDEEHNNTHNNNNTNTTRITQQQLDTCWKELHDTMMSAADASIGKVTNRPQSKYWWALAPDIHAIHDKMRRKRRMIRKMKHVIQHSLNNQQRHNITPAQLAQTRKEYRDAKKEFNASILKAKNAEWKQVTAAVETVTNKNKHNIVWNKWKRTKPSTRVAAASFSDKDGKPPIDETQALNNMAAHIARISSLPRSSMFDMAHEELVHQYIRDEIPDCAFSPHVHAPSFSLSDVEQACTTFRLNTSLGSDNVSPHFLRNGGKQLHRAIFMLFSICSWSGLVPSSFRHGHVMPIYKGEGQETDPDNYRPITITSVVARIYERVHKNELLEGMIAAGIPSKDQFGFTKHRSTHDAIYRLLSLIVDTSTQGDDDPSVPRLQRFVPTVFVDISKAYDKVWIDGLLYKLHHDLGIKGNLFYMIRAMLTSRTIQVICDGKISTMYVLDEGVAQGSILAPLLFLIYIHELTQVRGNGRTICMSLFADDISLLPLSVGNAGMNVLSNALDHMSAYARKWKITFSAKKTNVVYFKPGFGDRSTDSLKAYTPPHTHGTLKLTNFSIESAGLYKYLGVELDQFLTFIPYVRELIKKLNVTSHSISRLVRRGHAPSIPVIQTLVKSVLIPQMVYGLAFVPPARLENKSQQLKVTGIASSVSSVKGNLHVDLKRAMVLPIMRCMGQPYYVHHESLLVESRLLSISSLHSLSCVRLAHRWMSNALDSTNEASRLFRDHALRPITHRCHPFTHIRNNIIRIDTLQEFKHRPLFLSEIERNRLKELVWEQQYTRWTNDGQHPLQQQYNTTPTIQRNMPTYTHMDTPEAASNRARLRFTRARLRVDMKRVNFQDVTSVRCRQCGREDETVTHVLQDCDAPAVVDIRTRMNNKIHKLADKYKERVTEIGNILNPKAKNNKALMKAHKITGRMINLLRDIWDF